MRPAPAWKAFAVALAAVRAGERVLDCGRGSAIWRSISRSVPDERRGVAHRHQRAMLERVAIACSTAAARSPRSVRPQRAAVSFDYFDCVSIAFGLRNMTIKTRRSPKCAACSSRGRLLVLEFSRVGSRSRRSTTGTRFQGLPWLGKTANGGRGGLSLSRRIDPHAPRPVSA